MNYKEIIYYQTEKVRRVREMTNSQPYANAVKRPESTTQSCVKDGYNRLINIE